MPGISIYCLGNSALDTGQRREPTPPEITTGIRVANDREEEPNEGLISDTNSLL
jgi:hypothetical protein